MDWGQLRTIIWLRLRLTRNQWSRGGQLNAVLTILGAVAVLVLSAVSGIAGVLIGFFVLREKSPTPLLLAWDAFTAMFLFAWMIGLISEIQRSETIDISRMLHLPISLRDIFLVNYIASHLTISIILLLPLMLGLVLGLIFSGRWLMVFMYPLVLGFIFMVTAWTYCLRGWLAALMVNKRRRRAIIAGITFSFIVIAQLPNVIGNLTRDHKRHRPTTTKSVPLQEQTKSPVENPPKKPLSDTFYVVHKVVPFLWIGYGAMSLHKGNILPALLGTAGMFCIGGLGLRRAYRSTVRFYRGHTIIKKAKQKPKIDKIPVADKNFLERRLPAAPDEAAALALAFFRSLMRAPEIKMALATNFIFLLLFGTMFLAKRASDLSDNLRLFIAVGPVMFMLLGMSNLMFNQFGYDRGGFRQLVLLPVPRKYILLGKNLAYFPFVVGIGFVVLVIVKFGLHVSYIVILAAVFQLVAGFVLLSILGNITSVLVPYRITPGSLKRTKTSTKTAVMIFISRLLFPMAMAPIFFPPALGLLVSHLGLLPAGPVSLLLSIILMAILIVCYKLSLPGLGDLLLRQEKQILKVVTEEVE
ncbi:MAG: ABC transporter permease [Sedimentisphaerales bacterium]|nr:ABC transporter permease [Sedimentisphaerales bacterium]